MPTTPASKRPQHVVATMAQPHAAPVEQPHASAGSAEKKKGSTAAVSAKRPTSTQPQRGSTPAAKAQDARSSGGKQVGQPHAAPRMTAWEGGGTRSSIFDAAGGGGTRGINVSDFPELSSMVVSPRKGNGPPTTGKAVQPHASSALPGSKPAPSVRMVESLSKVSNSRQSSMPPFLWNPYLWYLGHSQGVSPRREYTRRIHALGLTTRRVLQAVVWMSVLPSMIMQSTRNMIEAWPMLAEVAERGGGVRVLRWREASTGAPSRMTRHRMRGSRHGHRSYRHRCTEVDRYKGIHKISEDRGGEGEGERGWDSGGMLACVVMAYGLVGAALADAPTPLHYNRHGHRRHRYRDMHRRRYSFDMYDARTGNEPKHRWHSSNITYLTQRLSWRVQGSGGGV